MKLALCRLVTLPLLVCLMSSTILITPVRAAEGDSSPGDEAPVEDPGTEPPESEPDPHAEDSGGGGGSSAGLVVAGVVLVAGGLGLWWWLSRDKKEKTVIDMEARNHLYEHRLNEATSLTFDAGPTPRMFMGHRGDHDELKMEDLACGEVGLRVVF